MASSKSASEKSENYRKVKRIYRIPLFFYFNGNLNYESNPSNRNSLLGGFFQPRIYKNNIKLLKKGINT